MNEFSRIEPFESEPPSHYADRLGQFYSKTIPPKDKKERGQFFTPVEIASFMVGFSENKNSHVRILDPGSGSGILSAALVERLTLSNQNLKTIDLVAFEIDPGLEPVLEQAFSYLRKWGADKGIIITTRIFFEDYILYYADCFNSRSDLFFIQHDLYDIIISNPPYFKIPIDDRRAVAAKVVVNGHPNIYAVFMALSAKLLKVNGELILITPRSFASGGYFRVFREYFFKIIDLDKAHLFISRKATFNRDKVLQETVIIKGIKRLPTDLPVTISASNGLKDLFSSTKKVFKKQDIVDLGSEEKILNLPTNDYEESVLKIFKGWTGNLSKYNIKISTGPVIAFRAKEFICDHFSNGPIKLAPLFWLHNVKQMALEWPKMKPDKGQYIKIEDMSLRLLLPNKNYIFLRRFSSKDDKNRLIAAAYFCNFIDSDYIGVENKLNYIYRPQGHLDRNEVIGLCALINSNLFDVYFRIFNGNVNVSATEILAMPFPDQEIIRDLGNTLILSNNLTVENVNGLVNEFFETEKHYEKNI